MIETFPLRFLLIVLAGWVNRHQLEVIDYLREENRILKQHTSGRRLRLTDDQRCRLAAVGHRLGRHMLNEWRRLSRLTPFCGGTDISSLANGRLNDGEWGDRAFWKRSAG